MTAVGALVSIAAILLWAALMAWVFPIDGPPS